MEAIIQDCLNVHNKYRAIHGSQPLKNEPKLNEYATVWATYLAKKGDQSRRKTKAYGENVYVGFQDDDDRSGAVVEAVHTWYQENKSYQYGEEQPANLKAVCHFTQLVWKKTKFMGLGMVTTRDGEVYVVCSYDPPGNVENKFDANVLAPVDKSKKKKEEDSKAKLRILQLKPQMDVVESMQCLYAVPSEKVRVWSVWLSQVGDEAEEWHKWLRLHIDLLMRMSEHLKEVEDAEKKSKRSKAKAARQARRILTYEEDAVTDDGIEYPRGVKDFYDIEQILADIVSGKKKKQVQESEEEDLEDEEEEEDYTLTDIGEESEWGDEEDYRMKGGADRSTVGSYSYTDEDVDDEEYFEDEEADDYLKEWPLGTQWEPFGIQEEEKPPDIIEKLELPKNLEEMEDMLRAFTATATIYRSYFKHWKETSDQAIKEMVGRTVMPTAIMRRILKDGDVKAALRICLNYPKGPFHPTNICYAPPRRITRLLALAERIGVEEFIKEMARANEDIPYFFYRTAEPDIEIAIQHDDEEVIPADPETEVIRSKYGRLRFNISDKPGMGGKCGVGKP